MSRPLLFAILIAVAFVPSTAGFVGPGIFGCLCTRPFPIFWYYAPICGEDGHTYVNICTALCHGVRMICRGPCPCDKTKPRTWWPTKQSPCPTSVKPSPSATPSPTQPTPTTPATACACPRIEAPVCGADGETYPNECLAKCAGTTVDCSGICPCAKPSPSPPPPPPPAPESPALECKDCPKVYDPVCGQDKKSYENACLAECSGTTVNCATLCPCIESSPSPPPPASPISNCKACPKAYDPVCGQDKNSYVNECWAKCAGMHIECSNVCPCDEPSRVSVS